MALTFPRWLALATIACAIAAVVILREPRSRADNRTVASDLVRREDRARRHVAIAAGRLRVLKLRDSLRANVPRDTTMRSRVLFSSDVPDQTRGGLSRVASGTETLRPRTPRVPVDLAFVTDTATTVRGAPRPRLGGVIAADYILPRPNTNDRCLVVARLRATPYQGFTNYYGVFGQNIRRRLLGPCAFYERFGHPGPQIAHWLRSHAWAYAQTLSWDAPYPQWDGGWRNWNYEGMIALSDWGVRSSVSPRGFACAGGEKRECEAAIVSGPNQNANIRRAIDVWGDIVSAADGMDQFWRENRWYFVPPELGPREGTILSEMARTLGPDRFSEFWQSQSSVSEAFQAASGQEIGAWTHDWAERQYGPQQRGPGLRFGDGALGGVLGVLTVALALSASRRRQII